MVEVTAGEGQEEAEHGEVLDFLPRQQMLVKCLLWVSYGLHIRYQG